MELDCLSFLPFPTADRFSFSAFKLCAGALLDKSYSLVILALDVELLGNKHAVEGTSIDRG